MPGKTRKQMLQNRKAMKQRHVARIALKAVTFQFESKYYGYDAKRAEWAIKRGKRARPTNQNDSKRVQNVVDALRALPANKLRQTTKVFLKDHAAGKSLSQMDSGKGLDMAHGESAQQLKLIVGGMLNTFSRQDLTPVQRKKKQHAASTFVEDFLTTDASDQSDNERFVKDIQDSAHPKKMNDAAAKLLNRMNPTRNNLTGGNSSINRHLAAKKDHMTYKDGTIPPKMQKRIDAVRKVEIAFNVKPAGQEFDSPGHPVSSTV